MMTPGSAAQSCLVWLLRLLRNLSLRSRLPLRFLLMIGARNNRYSVNTGPDHEIGPLQPPYPRLLPP